MLHLVVAMTRGFGLVKQLLTERVHKIIARMQEAYPEAQCELNFKNPFQLLVATILSAQCTDARVNIVTKELFKKYKTAKALAAADLSELEDSIYSTGFYRNKAKNIKNACAMLVDDYHGRVPNSMEELLKLPGVARKTANVILGNAYGIASGITVDTHALRVAQRLDLTKHKAPDKVEMDLLQMVPLDKWIDFSHQIVIHGRYTCTARAPKCGQCLLFDLCSAPAKSIA